MFRLVVDVVETCGVQSKLRYVVCLLAVENCTSLKEFLTILEWQSSEDLLLL